MSFFQKKKEKPTNLVKSCATGIKAFSKYEGNKSKQDKVAADVSNAVHAMKVAFYGDEKTEANPEAAEQLSNEILASDILSLLASNLRILAFEARKDLVTVFGNLIRRKNGNRFVTVEYVEKDTTLLDALCLGYEQGEVALTCGQLLRHCIEYESLARYILYSPSFFKFFQYVEIEEFDISSDAFATLKDLLTKHKTICAEFLEKNYDTIFQHYTKLLHSGNYVTRRQSLKLLGELLLDRANFNVMTKYISEQENLKLMMNLLRDKSRNIQFEAFHVFKVFVANPNKAKPILDILVLNKEKMIAFLDTFHNDKEDEQFADEKAFLLKQIEALPSL